MDLASAKDGNADNTTSKAQSEKNMTGSTASKNTTSKATTESKKETTTTTSPSTTVSSGNLSWPVPSCHSISSGYGYRIHPVTGVRKLHAGIDIPCSTGTTIVAAASGTVVDAGYNAYNGNYLRSAMEMDWKRCIYMLQTFSILRGKSVRRTDNRKIRSNWYGIWCTSAFCCEKEWKLCKSSKLLITSLHK